MSDLPARTPINYSLLGFVAVAFLMVGLAGVFSTYAIPVPLERALAREATFDDAMIAVRGDNPEAALKAMAPRLDDSLPAILAASGPLPDRIAAERLRQRERFVSDTAALGFRLRLLIVMVTAMAALFGVAITARRREP